MRPKSSVGKERPDLDVLHRLSPSLTSITMNVPLDDASTRMLLQFPHLKTIRRARISSMDVFYELANKPGLTSLGLKCADLVPQSAEIAQLPQAIRNPGLVELSLSGSCAALIPLFKCFHIPSLRRASLVLDSANPRETTWVTAEAGYVSCMDALVTAAPALEDVAILVEGPWDLSLSTLFAPFLPLSNMRRFVHDSTGNTPQLVRHTGNDDDFAAVGRAWGALEVLRLGPTRTFWKSSPTPSAMALMHLLASCPRLAELCLPALDPSLDRLAKADSLICQTTDGQDTLPGGQLCGFSTTLMKPRSMNNAKEMEVRWEAFLVRLFPWLARYQGKRKLLAGSIIRRHDGPLNVRCVSDSESMRDFSDDELYA